MDPCRPHSILLRRARKVEEMISLHQFLVNSFERIKPIECYTTGSHARDRIGNRVEFASTEAVCWCSTGSILREAHIQTELQAPSALTLWTERRTAWKAAYNLYSKGWNLLNQHMNNEGVANFHDNHTKKEVFAAWEKAIATAKEQNL